MPGAEKRAYFASSQSFVRRVLLSYLVDEETEAQRREAIGTRPCK